MNKYLIYFKRVYCGKTVGQGNWYVELEALTTESIEKLGNDIQKESLAFENLDIKQSTVIIANVIKLDS